jgi:hypothetical protein
MTLTIRFRAPTRSDSPSGPIIHERRIQQVPAQVVKEMVLDFQAYRADGTKEDQRTVYRFRVEGKETVLAVDFDEVIAIRAE